MDRSSLFCLGLAVAVYEMVLERYSILSLELTTKDAR